WERIGGSIMRVVCPDDCGNAPRKGQLRDFNVALVTADASAAELMREDIQWEVVGQRRLVGPEAVCADLGAMAGPAPQELHIHHIITHGATAALHATLTRADGSRLAYCDIYQFTGGSRSARLKHVTSYRLPLGG